MCHDVPQVSESVIRRRGYTPNRRRLADFLQLITKQNLSILIYQVVFSAKLYTKYNHNYNYYIAIYLLLSRVLAYRCQCRFQLLSVGKVASSPIMMNLALRYTFISIYYCSVDVWKIVDTYALFAQRCLSAHALTSARGKRANTCRLSDHRQWAGRASEWLMLIASQDGSWRRRLERIRRIFVRKHVSFISQSSRK